VTAAAREASQEDSVNTRMLAFTLVAAVSASFVALADGDLVPMSQDALLALPRSGDMAPFVLDVRTPEEYITGHLPGAVNIPHDQIAARLAEVPKDKTVVLYCRSGKRAGVAAEVLAENGYTKLQHLEGDMPAWIEKGRPVETPKDATACVAALKSGGPAPQACLAN
jgi:rhodanese-related sulfurtransferase